MKWTTFRVQKEPGFRFNLIDFLLIAFLVLTSYFLYKFSPVKYYFLLPLYIGFTFFLFCNVFRIGNNLEHVWYVPFLFISIVTYSNPDVYWKLVLCICEPLKIALILFRMVKGPYRGVFHQEINQRFKQIK
ncbi:hypothetical protein ACFL9U_03335 [Thermodesulfobacteriota bacterium]